MKAILMPMQSPTPPWMDNYRSIILMASLKQRLVGENWKFIGENGKILMRCRGNCTVIVGEIGGN